MIKNPTDKEKIGHASILISAILYIVIALDYLDQTIYWLFASLAAIGISNLIILKFKKSDSNVIGAIINSLNLLAAGLILIDNYQRDGRYLLWGFITLAYLGVTIMFISKKRASINK